MSNNFTEILARYIGPPVNIEAIVRSLGVGLDKKAQLDSEISGQIEKLSDGSFKISVNVKDSYFRQRFTIAHELGHFLLHANLIDCGVDDSKAYRSTPDGRFFNEDIGPTQETEANRFAAKVLMPKSLVTREAVIGSKVAKLATTFQVSAASMEIRLKTLGISTEDGVVVATLH